MDMRHANDSHFCENADMDTAILFPGHGHLVPRPRSPCRYWRYCDSSLVGIVSKVECMYSKPEE